MSDNRLLYAVLVDHDKRDGKICIMQRVVIHDGKTIADAERKIAAEYPTAQFLTWVTTFTSRYNSTDLHV